MTKYTDLSHYFENAMPGFKIKNEDGSFTRCTAEIKPFMTHSQSKPKFNGLCSFEITEMKFQTSIGTYIDSPFHRYPEKGDISSISLQDLICESIVVDVRNKKPSEKLGTDVLNKNLDFENKAVLFNFGWDKFWKKNDYHSYPFISEEMVDFLIARKIKLAGVDTINIDDKSNPERPAHSKFLKHNILIVENLTGLHKLHGKKFRFYAIPVKAKKTAAMPIRAFAEIIN